MDIKQNTLERWGLLELSFHGKSDGNPFTDYDIFGEFTQNGKMIKVSGFYDGDGIYRIRYMPGEEGLCTWKVYGSCMEKTAEGCVQVLPASGNNHGPVRVHNQYHFAYEDGTPYYPLGTTAYSFALQKKEIVEQTFSELEKGYFNKIRFCLMPKHYDFSLHDPVLFPYEGTPMDASVLTRSNFFLYNGAAPGNNWDFTRFNPAFFQLYDRMIERLEDLGVEADMILLHAYDRWGFSKMTLEQDEFYLRYVIARYSAYRNIWWALANEYELLGLTFENWEHLAEVATGADPYGHLISIHNCEKFYDYSRPWITHCSCQRCDHHQTTETTELLRKQYGKPVVWDEVGYEGDFPHCWGNFTPEELVRRCWEAIIRGGYCCHGETYLSDDNIISWAHGGPFKGESMKRFSFMKKFLEDVPGCGLKLAHIRDDYHWEWDDYVAVPEEDKYFGDYYFLYFSIWRPPFRKVYIDDENWYEAEAIDTYNMTIAPPVRFKGRTEIPMPGGQYCGIRIKKVKE